MLDLNPEIVCAIIEKARQFQVKEDVVIPEKDLQPEDVSVYQILVDHKDDPTQQEFVAMIEDLEPDQQFSLVALMWIGRGDYTTEEWDTAVTEAEAQGTVPTAQYLLGTPYLAEYLAEGLALFGYGCE